VTHFTEDKAEPDLFIYLFTQQAFTRCLLCVRY
jgi:hypothetical protein